MKYSTITNAYTKIESTSKRLEMTAYLVELLKKTPKELIRKVAYLTQGELYPEFKGIELGMAEKMVITAIAKATEIEKKEITTEWKRIGDLGSIVENLLSNKKGRKIKLSAGQPLTVEQVYNTLNLIAQTSGKGSVKRKVNLLTKLIVDATSKEAKYLIRTVTGRLRLGIGEMTFIDALADTYGSGKKDRNIVERAYNISSDIGLVSETLAKKGMEGVMKFQINLGNPIRPMLCERLTSSVDILTKLGRKGAAEYKYDGLRIQAHLSPVNIFLFSRRLENITNQFPDVCSALRESVNVREVIFEGECIAIDPSTGELRPFQVITKRRGRKYQIKKKVEEIPVVLVLFDVLYVDGQSLLEETYPNRRICLERVIEANEGVKETISKIVTNPEQIDELMEEAIENGCEGLVIKSMGANSIYQAGSRGFLWIKYKREYKSELADTLDLVVVGAFAGRGRRAGTYGALLMAAYNQITDAFQTVCKLGTGFDDATLATLPSMFNEFLIDHIHPKVDSKIKADYWFVPEKVLEIIGSELTLSPSHTCGLNIIKKGRGLAVRFPRFSGRWRDDKSSNDATRVKEIVKMYKEQLKTI